MARFFILLPGETEKDTINDRNLLGEIVFKKFRRGDGYKILEYIIEQMPESLEKITIVDSTGKVWSPEDFLDYLSKRDIYY